MRTKRIIIFFLISLSVLTISAGELPDTIRVKLKSLSPVEQVTFLSNLSWELREKQTDNALEFGNKAIQLADSLNLGQKLGRASNNVGVIYLHYLYKPKEAAPYLHKALELALENNDSINIAYAYNNLGDLYYLSGNVPLAHNFADKSMEYCIALNDSVAIAYTHINYGLVYLLENQYEKALDHLFKAISIRKKFDHKLGIASAYQQVGSVYYEMGNYAKAMHFFQLAYIKNKQIDNKKWMAFSLDGIGKILYEENKYDEALSVFKEALNLNEERDHLYGAIDNKLGMALVYSQNNNRRLGEELISETIQDAKKLALPKKLLETYKTFSTFYLNVRDFEAARISLNKYQEIYDSLYSAQQFETLWEVQKSAEINQRLKNSEHELQIKQIEELYFVIIIILLIVVVFVIFWRYRSNKILNEKLSKSNEAKDKIFSIISHDLRNPFHTLMGLLDLLKDKDLSQDERKEIINSFDSATRSTYQLLENLLSLSATKRGKIAFYPEKINVASLVDSVISSVAPQLKDKSLSIEKKINEFRVTADKKMVEIILRNLITNAIKYSHEGTVIKISSEVNENYCLSIEDYGIGMNETTREQLFKSEIQNSTYGTAGEKGTGIGLSLCKEFVEKHNGSIKVESEEGKGSKFTFCLPI